METCTCLKCNKKLDGVTLSHGHRWICSSCITNKKDVLHCERGSKVKVVSFDVGFISDAEQAKQYLALGNIYEVDTLEIGGYSSRITLKEIPNIPFNTLHFMRYEGDNND